MKRNSNITNAKNDIYITLKNERNYFQGDMISGSVVLDLQSVTRTQNVKITLEGIALIHNKPTTIYTRTKVLMEPPAGEKFVTLDAHSHSYNFHLEAPSSKALPSTLEISDLMTVQYKLVAVQQVQFGLLDFSKVHPSSEKEINILERIDVNEFPMNFKELREVSLMGFDKKIRVTVDLFKCAAVKGATIPISITIDHVGVMVKDKAIKVRLLRNVYYQSTRLNLDGPEVVASTNGDIMIIGPMEFSATTRLKLLIPSKICPTVEETGKTFKVEYLVNIIVNLNEESPHIKEKEEEIVIFDIPFTIGTYPQLDYCIDDDDEEEEEDEVYKRFNNSIGNNGQEIQEEEKEKVRLNNNNNNNGNNEDPSTEEVVKAMDQIRLDSSSGIVLPEIIEQKQKPLLEEYKPDEKPDQEIPHTKRRTMTYESGVQLAEFIENEPMLPVQIVENDPEDFIEKKKQDPYIPPPQRVEEEEEVSLPQQSEEESLPEEIPTSYPQKDNKEKGRPLMMNQHSSTTSFTQIPTNEKAGNYIPTPTNSSRPSSPLPTYQVSSSFSKNQNTSNASLPIYNTKPTGVAVDEYQLPTEITPRIEKKSSYLSMNSIPDSPSPPANNNNNNNNNRLDYAAPRPALPPRNNSPLPPLQYGGSSDNLTTYNTSPPIPPRNNNVSPAFNKPPLPPRTNMVSPPLPQNNNYGYGPPPPSSQFDSMPRPQHHNSFYSNPSFNNSSNNVFNSPSFPSPNGMPMPMPSQSSQPTYSYPDPSYHMPQPQHSNKHYYQ